jgi:hypothetical protein
VPRFVETAVRIGVPKEWYDGARSAGPLATFDGTDEWVPHPYRDGVALIGDAASTSDPTWGQGMSLTLRDLRLLSDRLLAEEDWDAATEHACRGATTAVTGRRTPATTGTPTSSSTSGPPPTPAVPVRCLSREDPTRIPTRRSAGEVPADETARRRFFGDDGLA